MLRRIFGFLGLGFACGLGAILGGWITNKQDPVQFLSRKILTPVVRPGDDVEAEVDNYRLLRCPQKIYRVVSLPNGKRTVVTEDRPAGFGKLGRDKYITGIPTPPDAPYGKATVYSYIERMCNPWEWMFPVVYADPWTDHFEFGPETRRISANEAPNTLTP